MKKEDINKICKIAAKAGKAVLEVYNSGNFEIETKKDISPLTLADSKSNEVISKELDRFLFDGEEGQTTSGAKLQWKTGKNPDIFKCWFMEKK